MLQRKVWGWAIGSRGLFPSILPEYATGVHSDQSGPQIYPSSSFNIESRTLYGDVLSSSSLGTASANGFAVADRRHVVGKSGVRCRSSKPSDRDETDEKNLALQRTSDGTIHLQSYIRATRGSEGLVRWASLKTAQRALEKTVRCYGDDPTRLCDLARQVG